MQGAALAQTGRPFPVILFSHGLAGTRNTYSLFCSELASRGYVVLALEHACGTASTCHLAGSGSALHQMCSEYCARASAWRLYEAHLLDLILQQRA